MTTSVAHTMPVTEAEPVSTWWEAEHGLMLKNVPNLTYEALNRLKRVLCTHRPAGP